MFKRLSALVLILVLCSALLVFADDSTSDAPIGYVPDPVELTSVNPLSTFLVLDSASGYVYSLTGTVGAIGVNPFYGVAYATSQPSNISGNFNSIGFRSPSSGVTYSFKAGYQYRLRFASYFVGPDLLAKWLTPDYINIIWNNTSHRFRKSTYTTVDDSLLTIHDWDVNGVYGYITFSPKEDFYLQEFYLAGSNLSGTPVTAHFFVVQGYLYFISYLDMTFDVLYQGDSVVDAINNQTQQIQDFNNQGFGAGVNPKQDQVLGDLDTGINDMDNFEKNLYTNIGDYKSGLDFSFSAFSEAASGLDYIRGIFMDVWNNSPVAPIVLSMMLGLVLLLIGRGARSAMASSDTKVEKVDRNVNQK